MVGLLLGLTLAIGAGRLISAQLYDISAWVPPALSIAIIALTICSFFASIIPANRAASIPQWARCGWSSVYGWIP